MPIHICPMSFTTLFAGQQWRNRDRELTYGHGEMGGEGRLTQKLTSPYVK